MHADAAGDADLQRQLLQPRGSNLGQSAHQQILALLVQREPDL